MAECANEEICPFFRDMTEKIHDNKEARKKELLRRNYYNHMSRAFCDKDTEYYQLLIDIGRIRKGTYDPEDDIRGAWNGCLKMCWTFDGDCYNDLAADTIVFHKSMMEDETVFKKVSCTFKERDYSEVTACQLATELAAGNALYNPANKYLYILDGNSKRACGVHVLKIRKNTNFVIKELSKMEKPDLALWAASVVPPNIGDSNQYGERDYYHFFDAPLHSKKAIFGEILQLIRRLLFDGKSLITADETMRMMGVGL